MSCACEHKKMSKEYKRIRSLAKTYAKMESITIGIYRKENGSYDFSPASECENKNIVEFLTKY